MCQVFVVVMALVTQLSQAVKGAATVLYQMYWHAGATVLYQMYWHAGATVLYHTTVCTGMQE